MTVDAAAKMLDLLVKLLGAIIWPLVVLFLSIRFGPAITNFISNLGEFSLKGPGFEASGKREEAAAALAAAAVSHTEPNAAPGSAARDTREAANVVSDVVTPRLIRRAGQATVLWVDDNPDNNIHERQSLEALGVNFVLALSTEEALGKLSAQSFDAVISDMDRPPDPQAGYTLLEKLRKAGNLTPYFIYSSSRSVAAQIEARRRGATGCTNRPIDLFRMVLSVLGQPNGWPS
jgi:CheY-like chemotaxis protein